MRRQANLCNLTETFCTLAYGKAITPCRHLPTSILPVGEQPGVNFQHDLPCFAGREFDALKADKPAFGLACP